MKKKIILAALLLGMFSTSAVAQVSVSSVRELQLACGKTDSASALNACLALVNLALDNIRKEEQSKNRQFICNKDVLNIRVAKEGFLTWAAAHPDAAGMDPELGVRTALAAAYPCASALKEAVLPPPPPPPPAIHPAMPPRSGRNR